MYYRSLLSCHGHPIGTYNHWVFNALFPVRGCHRGVPLRFPSKTLEMLIMSGLTPYQTLQDLLPQKSTKIWVYVIRVGGGRSLMWSTAPNCCYLGPVETIETGANWKQLYIYIDYGRLTLWNNQPTKPTPGMNHSTLEVKPTDNKKYSPQFWRIKISQTLGNRTRLVKTYIFLLMVDPGFQGLAQLSPNFMV